MKTLLTLASIFVLAACGSHGDSALQSQVAERQTMSIGFGSYTLTDEIGVQIDPNGCTIALTLDIVNGPTGGTLVLKNTVIGVCEIVATPNPREYNLTSVTDDGCGTKIYEAELVNGKGAPSVTLIDHRLRRCDDVQRSTLVLVDGAKENLWYLPPPSLDHVSICMAHWMGFEINPLTNTCEARSASGCRNPFPFQEIAVCQRFYRL